MTTFNKIRHILNSPPISVQNREADDWLPEYVYAVNQGFVPMSLLHQLRASSNLMNTISAISISVRQVCASPNLVIQGCFFKFSVLSECSFKFNASSLCNWKFITSYDYCCKFCIKTDRQHIDNGRISKFLLCEDFLLTRFTNFDNRSESVKLYDLVDIFTEIELSMTDQKYDIWVLFDFQSFAQRIPLG